MEFEWAPLAGYILAAVLLFIAFGYWRRAINLHALLVEAARRFESTRKQNQQLETDVTKATEKLAAIRDVRERLEKSLDDARNRIATLTSQIETRQTGQTESLARRESQIENLSLQVAALTQQLSVADREAGDARQQLALNERTFQERARESMASYETQLAELQNKVRHSDRQQAQIQADLEKARGAAQAQAKADQGEEIKTLQRRLSQLDHLYTSMRGMREMAEERNHNWEVALRKLSVWILKQNNAQVETMAGPIGPLVGEALAIAGEQLIDDDEVFSATPTSSQENTNPTSPPSEADLS